MSSNVIETETQSHKRRDSIHLKKSKSTLKWEIIMKRSRKLNLPMHFANVDERKKNCGRRANKTTALNFGAGQSAQI